MKRIKLKSLSIRGFKGLREFNARFNDGVTTVSAKNGKGKSTLADAFVWLLFGKNMDDAKVFNIKTLDASGVAIPKIPHEVKAVLDVDGKEIILCRQLNEKWVRKNGTAEEVFDGNKEAFFVNEVPVKLADYKAKVSELCDEYIFKALTRPMHFNSLAWKDQRELLFHMAGGVTDAEVAGGDSRFNEVLAILSEGKTIEEYKREIGAKKKVIKGEIENIPSRIDECQRAMPESANWSEVERTINAKEMRLNEVNTMLSSMLAQQDHIASARRALINERESVYRQRMELRSHIAEEANKEYYNQNIKKNDLNFQANYKREEINRLKTELKRYTDEYERRKQMRLTLLDEYHQIQSRELVIPEENFICPTCKRPFDESEIEEIKEKVTSTFNTNKADALEQNKKRGMENKDVMERTSILIGETEAKILAREKELNDILANPILTSTESCVSDKDINALVEKNEEYIALSNREDELAEQINKPMQEAFNAEERAKLSDENYALNQEISQLKKQLANRDNINSLNKRIAELESNLREQSQALAELEAMEYNVDQFSAKRIEMMSDKVNSLFRFTKFNLFKHQQNGGYTECCEASVNGVPYSDLNTSMKIWCGLDIIDAMSKFYGVSVTAFVDNAEVCNSFPEINSQVVYLYVSNDNELVVK